MFLSAGEIVCTGRLLVADEECFIGAISPNDYLPYGSRGQRCTCRIQVHRLPGRAFKRIVSRRRFEEQATRTNVTLGRWATLRRCSAFWFTIAALVVGYFIYLRTVSAWLAVSPLLFAVAASIGQARFRRGTAQQ